MAALSASVASWDLVVAAQRGDRDAFGQLYDRYVDDVFRYLLRYTRKGSLTEDLTAETFVRALRSIDLAPGRGAGLRPWLLVIARNVFFTYVTSSRYRRETVVADLLDSSTDDRSPERRVIDIETANEVMSALAKLPSRWQECLRLRFWQELSFREIAAVMGTSVKAVERLQCKALRRLAELLPQEVA